MLIRTLITDAAIHTGCTGTDTCPCLERSRAEWEDRAVRCPSSQLKQHTKMKDLSRRCDGPSKRPEVEGAPLFHFPWSITARVRGQRITTEVGGGLPAGGALSESLLYGPWGGVRDGRFGVEKC